MTNCSTLPGTQLTRVRSAVICDYSALKKKKKSSTYFEVFAYNLLKKMDLQTRHAVSGRGTGGDDDTKKKMMGEEHDLPHQEMTNDRRKTQLELKIRIPGYIK